MTVGLILISVTTVLLLLSLMYLSITQRSEHRTTMEQQMNMTESTIRLVLQSSNSQSADMTDMLTKLAKSQSTFLEMVTLGREMPTSDSSSLDLTQLEKQLLAEPSDSDMPLHIQEALRREREAEETMMMEPSTRHLPSHLNRQEFASEMNGGDPMSQVEITPL